MTNVLRRLANGVIPQAVIAGSLSFSHIHDLANAHGQTGWKAWTYPLSVDLLTVAAYRNMRERRTGPVVGWFWFLLSLAASLAANIVATGGKDALSVCVGVWPSVAFLGCTFLGHSGKPEASDDPAADEVAVDESPVVDQPADDDRGPVAKSTVVEPVELPIPLAPPEPRPAVEISADLLAFAARVASDHERQHGRPIDAVTLRQRLGVTPSLAEAVFDQLRAPALAAT